MLQREKHRKNCESWPTQVTWKVKLECQFCLSWFRQAVYPAHDRHVHHIYGDHDDLGDYKEVGGCIQGRWRLYTRKLEIVYKEVVSDLI